MEVLGAMATVAELISYPVKGCAGVPLGEAVLTESGLAHDRTFMAVDADGVFRSQRRDPLLAVLQPAVSADGGLLTLRAPGVEDLGIKVDLGAARRDVFLFRSRYQGIDQGEAAAEWLSSVLGRPSRLVRVPPEHQRVTEGWTPGAPAYADSGSVHAISRATLRELNRYPPLVLLLLPRESTSGTALWRWTITTDICLYRRPTCSWRLAAWRGSGVSNC